MNREPGAALALLAATAVFFSACSESQDAPSFEQTETPGAPSEQPLPGDSGQSETDLLFAEFQKLQQRLGAARQQAMADSAIAQEFADLQAFVEAEMRSTEPELDAKQTRIQSLLANLDAARAAGDEEQAQSIIEEGNALQAELQQVQVETMKKETVVARMEAFRETITERMTEIDPETPELIARSEAISAQLQGP